MPCTETYCLNRDHTDAEGCTWPEHAAWCDGNCTKNADGECTLRRRYGRPSQGSGFYEVKAQCVMDAATYITGEFDVHDTVQLTALIATLMQMRERLAKEEALKPA